MSQTKDGQPKYYRTELLDLRDPVAGPFFLELLLTCTKPPIVPKENIPELVEECRQKCLRIQKSFTKTKKAKIVKKYILLETNQKIGSLKHCVGLFFLLKSVKLKA